MKDEIAKKKGLPFSTSRSQEKAYKKNTKRARRQADKKACTDHWIRYNTKTMLKSEHIAKRERAQIIEQIKDYAVENYDHPDERWDLVIEAWDDDTIDDKMQGATTFDEAVKCIRPIVQFYAEQEANQRYE